MLATALDWNDRMPATTLEWNDRMPATTLDWNDRMPATALDWNERMPATALDWNAQLLCDSNWAFHSRVVAGILSTVCYWIETFPVTTVSLQRCPMLEQHTQFTLEGQLKCVMDNKVGR